MSADADVEALGPNALLVMLPAVSSSRNVTLALTHAGEVVAIEPSPFYEGEAAWVNESVAAFGRCEGRFGTEHCALSFESLTRENEETFYHCDQLIKGLYATFVPVWRREHARERAAQRARACTRIAWTFGSALSWATSSRSACWLVLLPVSQPAIEAVAASTPRRSATAASKR